MTIGNVVIVEISTVVAMERHVTIRCVRTANEARVTSPWRKAQADSAKVGQLDSQSNGRSCRVVNLTFHTSEVSRHDCLIFPIGLPATILPPVLPERVTGTAFPAEI